MVIPFQLYNGEETLKKVEATIEYSIPLMELTEGRNIKMPYFHKDKKGREILNNPFIDFKISNFDFGTDESINYIDFYLLMEYPDNIDDYYLKQEKENRISFGEQFNSNHYLILKEIDEREYGEFTDLTSDLKIDEYTFVTSVNEMNCSSNIKFNITELVKKKVKNNYNRICFRIFRVDDENRTSSPSANLIYNVQTPFNLDTKLLNHYNDSRKVYFNVLEGELVIDEYDVSKNILEKYESDFLNVYHNIPKLDTFIEFPICRNKSNNLNLNVSYVIKNKEIFSNLNIYIYNTGDKIQIKDIYDRINDFIKIDAKMVNSKYNTNIPAGEQYINLNDLSYIKKYGDIYSLCINNNIFYEFAPLEENLYSLKNVYFGNVHVFSILWQNNFIIDVKDLTLNSNQNLLCGLFDNNLSDLENNKIFTMKFKNSTINVKFYLDSNNVLTKIIYEREKITKVQESSTINELILEYNDLLLSKVYDNKTKKGICITKTISSVELYTYTNNDINNCLNKVIYEKYDDNIKMIYSDDSIKTIYFDDLGVPFLVFNSDKNNYNKNPDERSNENTYLLNNNYFLFNENKLVKTFIKSFKNIDSIMYSIFDGGEDEWKKTGISYKTNCIVEDNYLDKILGEHAYVLCNNTYDLEKEIDHEFKRGDICRLEFWIKKDEFEVEKIDDLQFTLKIENNSTKILNKTFILSNSNYVPFVFYFENKDDSDKLFFNISYNSYNSKFFIKKLKLHIVGKKDYNCKNEFTKLAKYDRENRLYFNKDGLNILEYTYNEKNLITKIKNHFYGNEVLYEYDINNNIIQETKLHNSELVCVTKFNFYPNGLLKKIIDNNNLETIYNYDVNNNVIDIVNSDGTSYKYEYNGQNKNTSIKSALNDDDSFITYDYTNEILTLMSINNKETYQYLYNDYLLFAGYNYCTLNKEVPMKMIEYVTTIDKQISKITNNETPNTIIEDNIENHCEASIEYEYDNTKRLEKININNDYKIIYNYFNNEISEIAYTYCNDYNSKEIEYDNYHNLKSISQCYSENDEKLEITYYMNNNKSINLDKNNFKQMYLYNNLNESSILYEIEKYNSVNINDYMIGSMPQPLFCDYSTSYNVLSEFDPILHSNVLLFNNKKHYSEINLSKINNYRTDGKLYGNINYSSSSNSVKNKLDIIMLFKPCGDNVELFTLKTNNEINFRFKIYNGLNIELFDENNSNYSEKITNIELSKWHLLRVALIYDDIIQLLVNLDGQEVYNNLNDVTDEQTNNIIFNKIILGNYNHEEDLTHSNLNVGYFSVNSKIDYSNTDRTATDNLISKIINYLKNPSYVSNIDIISFNKNYDVIDFNNNLFSVNGIGPDIVKYDENYIDGIFEYDYELKKNVLNMTKNKLYNNQTSQNIICYQLSSNNLKNLKIKFKCTKCGSNNSLLHYEKNDFDLYLDEYNNINLKYTTNEDSVIVLQLCNITLNTWHEFSYRFNNGVLYYCLDGVGYSQNIIEPYLEDSGHLYVGNYDINNCLNGYIEYIKFSTDSEVDLDNNKIIYYQKKYSNQNFVSSESIKYGNKTLTKTYEKLSSNFKNNIPNVETNFDNTKTHYHYNKDGMLVGVIVYDNFNNMIIEKHYFYDSYNQIIKEECYNSVDSNNNYIIRYEYDFKGNIVKKQEYSTEYDLICEYEYVYDTYIPNNLLSVVKRLPDGTETTEYNVTYFENFIKAIQTISKKGTNYKIKYLNNWITSIGNNKYYYDNQGLRIKKITENNEEFTYYYEDNRLVHMTFNINDISEHSITYLYNDTNQLIGLNFNDKPYFYNRDLTGNINSIVDINGKVMVKYYYDAYGKPTIQCLDQEDDDYSVSYALSKCNVFMYKGYIYDVETNLALISSRYYSPELGRFIQPADISSLDPQSINGLNLYTYAVNNPIAIKYDISDSSMGSVMDNSFIGNGVVSDGYYTSDPNTSVKFPKPKLYTTLADFISSMSGAISVIIWTSKNPQFFEFFNYNYGISKYQMLNNLKSPLVKAAKWLSYGIVAYETYDDIKGHINVGDSWQTTISSGIVTAGVGALNVWVSGELGAAIGGFFGGVPGFIIGTLAGVGMGIIINGIFYTEINGKSIAGHIEDGIEGLLEWLF
ncbi:MAG: hypothetical protein IJB21_03550 [Bacilli bacterium]|nr:hypothetical protein [Bacilli bacterium]